MTASKLVQTPDIRQLHKFGGSSLADSAGYLRVADIIINYSKPNDLIVVSAAGSTTTQLIQWWTTFQQDRKAALFLQTALKDFHLSLIHDLIPVPFSENLTTTFIDDLARLANLLEKSPASSNYAEIVGHGEIWSARLLADVLKYHQHIEADWLDARQFLRAGKGVQPQIIEDVSRTLLQKKLNDRAPQRWVITGFIAADENGKTLLLGRNGSDYSATQIGALAKVDRVTIWSDVAGVYSADPRKVPDACLLPLLRLDEASELARLGAPVLHARTLQPITNTDIDLRLRCSYNPEQGSTRIERILATGTGARVVTGHNDVCLIDIHIASFDESHEASFENLCTQKERLEKYLARKQLRALAVGMHRDQGRIQFCYTREVVNDVFSYLQNIVANEIKIREGFSLVAMVGAGVTRNPLHTHRFWQQISDQPVEFVWPSEEGNSLVAVLRTNSIENSVRGLHQSLFRAEKCIGLVLFGKGNIGSRWLELFATQQKHLSARTDFEFVLAGVVEAHQYLLNYEGLDPCRVQAFFESDAKIRDDETLFSRLTAHPFDDLVIIDITADEALAEDYSWFAQQGFHVISANKIAGATASKNWRKIRDTFAKTHRYWLYNATVGASLPINHAVRDLRESGDNILKISGRFSGTLSWVLSRFDGKIPFTELLLQAFKLGITEPDPRTDLSGLDSMRKLIILAREAGYDIEPDHVRRESLVPKGSENVNLHDFFNQAEKLNAHMLQRLNAAREMDLLLCYVSRFDAAGLKAKVGIEAVRKDDPLANLHPCDNVFVIESRWYRDNPLVIRGPGTGRDVTAGAIQSDLNRLAQLL